MKYLVAIIQPHRLQSVTKALLEEGIYSMTVSNALGCGEEEGYTEIYRGVTQEIKLLKHLKVELFLDNDLLERAINAIIKGARTGESGDGKICVMELSQCVKISTLERGFKAL